MAHKLGAPKVPNSGRKKGTPNKKTQSLFEICEEQDLNVFQAMVVMAKEGDASQRFTVLKELAQYLYPKRKSLEHSGSIDPRMAEAAETIALMSKEEQIEALKEELEKLENDK